ncbi:tRNA (guanine-N(7)-)-methyltransferase non-catalytic subunit wdr4 [Micropterus dolomieu]|uniref:tRNA (guanine-N(7)-)-methyltransferase non-catalytic subunit wdr4 n=1 Tax=Micropterus dolomieu TaxID=147949 RepID=UPI001E8EB752|nr:tRNA (guanine-N(7)-)-methyltransferase non-catalytic subunit wdr4 [Micropterus dolomieu]
MAAVGFSGEWCIFTCDKKLVAVDSKQAREPFVFDCSAAEKKPKNVKDDNSDGSTSEETGSDKILAFTVSPSGKLVALTDDNKRLVLFHCEPSWQCISIRWVVRRCTSLHFTQAEDKLLVADKSGDVYCFSVVEPQREGELKMGHLSMLLAVTMSPDDKYIITADRDEKIRVSLLNSPYNIQSFCLGHKQFVSALLVPSGHPNWLLSGSGDGTIKLWEYETGHKLQSWELNDLEKTPSSEADKQKCLARIPVTNLFLLLFSYTATTRTNNRFEHLYKVSFDNVTAYLQKKQQRVEEQQLKRKTVQRANSNKKAKKEMSKALMEKST